MIDVTSDSESHLHERTNVSGQSNLESLAKLKLLGDNLLKMREQTARELEAANMQLRCLEQWIEDWVPGYWEEQMQLAKRRYVETRQVLSDCESKIREDEQRSCSEPKKRVERAVERVAFCERKLRVLKQCQRDWRQEVEKLRPRIGALTELVESGFPLAIAKLQKHIDVISKYSEVV